MLLFTEGNLEMKNESGDGQDCAFGQGGPGQSWLARSTFGECICFLNYSLVCCRAAELRDGL